jgi:hypothetical protein
MPDRHAATLLLWFPDEEGARTALGALAPDNEGHLEARLKGTTLVLSASSATPMGLLRTLDDALGCLRALGMA